MALGTSPPKFATIVSDAPRSAYPFMLKKPVDRISSSTCPAGAEAIAAGVGYVANSRGVTIFTRSSVHCAERIVAERSSNGFRKSSAQVATGNSFKRSC